VADSFRRLGGGQRRYGISGRRVATSLVTRRSKPFPQRHRLSRTHSRTADKRVLGASFSQAASYLSVEEGGMQGKAELAEALDMTGVV
jgi:hypothetical protein